MKLKILLRFVRKYGRPESVTIFLDSETNYKIYSWKNNRWVGHDTTGEMGWDGKRNYFNT